MPPRPLFLLLALAACVEFEGQTILLVRDETTDTIRMRLVYRGIHAGKEKGDPARDVAEALEQLKETAERGTRFYLLDNWPFAVDVGPPEEGEKDEPVNVLLRPHAKVKNGTFFFDGQGRLCAWQDVEIAKASELLRQANRLLALAVLAGKVDALEKADDVTRKLVQQSLAKGETWIAFDRTGLSLRVPLSEADAARVKRSVLADFVRAVEKEARSRDEANAEGRDLPDEPTAVGQMLRVLAENRISLLHEGDVLTIRLSPDPKGVVRLDWWNPQAYEPNLLQPLKQGDPPPALPLPLDRKITEEQILAFWPRDEGK